MNADRIPYEPPSDHEVGPIRSAIERHKAKQNARDEASQPKPASDDVGVE